MPLGGPSRLLLALLLVAAVAAAGCTARDAPPEDASEFPGDPEVDDGPVRPDLPGDGPPGIEANRTVPDGDCPEREPAPTSTLIPAEGGPEAPHPVAYDGTYERLEVRGTSVDLPSPLRVLPLPRVVDLSMPCIPDDFGNRTGDRPPQLALSNATGRFVPDEGSPRNLTGDPVRAAAEAPFRVRGAVHVETTSFTAREGRIEVRLLGTHPLPTGDLPGNRTPETGAALVVGPDGASLADVHVDTSPGAEPVRRAADAGPDGTLELEPGRYVLSSGRLASTPDPLPVPEADTVVLEPAEGNLTLRDQPVEGSSVRLAVDGIRATVDAARNQTGLEAQVDQWYEGSRPRIGAGIRATFNATGTDEATLRLEPGENATAWVRAGETSRVGSAVGVEARADPPEEINATTGAAWHPEPDPGALQEGLASLVGIFTGTDTTVAPGDASYTPLYVSVPDDARRGRYRVPLGLSSVNAGSAAGNLTVQVAR